MGPWAEGGLIIIGEGAGRWRGPTNNLGKYGIFSIFQQKYNFAAKQKAHSSKQMS